MKRVSLLGSLVFLVACNGGPNKTNIELIQNMMDQPSVKSQDWIPEDGDKGQMRTPPPHTIARGTHPYKFADDIAGADKEPNPFAGQTSPEVLSVGHKYYEVYCTVCHGKTGHGDGPAAEKMAVKPRNLVAPDAKGYSDGRIYHAITAGKGVMRAYISQIPDPEGVAIRWKIVNYVRSLQK